MTPAESNEIILKLITGLGCKKLRKIDHKCQVTKNPIDLTSSAVHFLYDPKEILEYIDYNGEYFYWIFDRMWEEWIALSSLDVEEIEGYNQPLSDSAKKIIDKVIENLTTSLGVQTKYIDKYDKTLLVPVSRLIARNEIGYEYVPFQGLDIWNGYEVSYLDKSGKPHSKMIQIAYSADSENIVESKSLKLYLNSFNQTKLEDSEFIGIIEQDLKDLLITDTIRVSFFENLSFEDKKDFINIDELSPGSYEYTYNPDLLLIEPFEHNKISNPVVKLKSNLLKSNCRHSGLPDWGSCYIEYRPSISTVNPGSLLQYIISFRNIQEFHEECCERIFHDLWTLLNPEYLKVSLNYTRRGGLDINPIRFYTSKGEDSFDFYNEISKFQRTQRQ